MADHSQLAETIEHLASRWARFDRHVLRHVFPLLAEGRAVSADCLARASDASSSSVTQALDPRAVALDDEGRIVEIFGVSLSRTAHRVTGAPATLFTCCALVAHVLPRLLGSKLRVESEDPVNGQSILLSIGPTGVLEIQPEIAMASMIRTSEHALQENAALHFCRHVHHFTSRKTVESFVADDARRHVVTIAELDAAAVCLYTKIWSRS